MKQNTFAYAHRSKYIHTYVQLAACMQVSTGEAAKATEAGAIGVKMALIRNSTNPVTIIRYIMQIPQVGTKPH